MSYMALYRLPLEEQRIILMQRINRAGLKRLRRLGLPIPVAALEIEQARMIRRMREVSAVRLLDATAKEA